MKEETVGRLWMLVIGSVILSAQPLLAQSAITGTVYSDDGPLAYAAVIINDSLHVQTDEDGVFVADRLPSGRYRILASYLGYQTLSREVSLPLAEGKKLAFVMERDVLSFDEIVVTGTKTFKRQTQSAVIVNVIDSKTLDQVQACNLSEGLRFQPGLRVENDCQTCNYTQLRMNGLAGGYSQILINGRPIFSPLTGLYGLEQIPTNMVDRIEVIRGGGSSLYGSSAIGGSVNILTKIPRSNSYGINTSYHSINGDAVDYLVNANSTLVTADKNAGLSLFVHHRDRQAYDHNGDIFSELPELRNTSVGINTFYRPTDQQKLELSLSSINEYRYGGELVDGPADQALQAEERTHHVWMGSLDYQVNFNKGRTSLISYAAWQRTDRDHYTGILPDEDDTEALAAHRAAPPYGTSLTSTYQAGMQLNQKVDTWAGGNTVLTLGAEYLVDDTFDEIAAYRYEVDQLTKDLGLFAQSDWEILPSLNLLSGIRIDKHNFVEPLLLSPRVSLLYKHGSNTQVRASYGTGFRAPQAFDTDLHIAFAGGGVSRVQLSDELREETSESYTISINYDKPTEHWVAGFTLEGFYTQLHDAFALVPLGADDFGERFEKRNENGATVQGATLELRANYDQKVQLEGGLTIQTSRFDRAVEYIEGVEGTRDFIRTPNTYGFAHLSLLPTDRLSLNINYVLTGPMLVPHFAGAPNQDVDEIITSPTFSEVSTKVSYRLPLDIRSAVEIYAGVKNIFNSYQSSFDIGKNRDSNFVYGPAQPRSFYVGVKWDL